MSKTLVPAIVFADVDDVRVNRTSSAGPVAGILETLANERIVVVFCSHRTRADIEAVRQALGVFHPFVCENGAAVFVPGRYFGSEVENARAVGGYEAIEFARPYSHARETLRRVARHLKLDVLGFSDMSVEFVARECRVSLLEAQLIKLREFDEPFRLVGADPVAERRLLKALQAAGLTCTRRGSFHHAGTIPGPGAAVSTLIALYRVAFGSVLTAAKGEDGPGNEITRRVDFLCDGGRTNPTCPGDCVQWLESIVASIRAIRDARPSWAVAQRAR